MDQTLGLLFHYTSLDAFINIIKSKKFRLCDVTKSNDPLEGTYMIQALEESYRRLYRDEEINKNEWFLAHRAFIQFQENVIKQGRNKDFYGAASFCVPAHELMMLRSYADNGKGVALGVPITVLKTLAENNSQLEFGKMEYLSKEEINQRAKDFWIKNIKQYSKEISEINEETLIPFVNEIEKYYHQSFFYKDEVNKDEQEYRLLFHCEDLFQICLPCIGKEVPQEIDFISYDGNLKAYYEIPVGDKGETEFYFSDVIIGPQCKATITEIQTFLCRYGINGCSVLKNSWVQMR